MKILFLTGPHAVGKSYFMKQLSETNDFFQFDTGPEMRKMHKELAPKISIMDWVNLLEKDYGNMITCDMLCKVLESKSRHTENIIVTGFRQIEGINYMIEYFKPENFEILFIDANFELLKNNYQYREKVKVTDEEFRKYLKDEEEWGLSNLRQFVLTNPEHCQYIKKNSNDQTINTTVFEKEKNLNLKREVYK